MKNIVNRWTENICAMGNLWGQDAKNVQSVTKVYIHLSNFILKKLTTDFVTKIVIVTYQ